MPRTWKLVGINFDHMHMGDLLRLAHAHPRVEIVGVADEDPGRVAPVIAPFGIPDARVYTSTARCLEETQPDIAVVCAATGKHGDTVVEIAPHGCHVLVEKPFAANLADADRMVAAMAATGKTLAINWPLAWYPPHVTTKRLIDAGTIGAVVEVHYYDGNRGPLRHLADKVEVSEEEEAARKADAWWYQRRQGGGSLQDYLGYGVTLGTWFLNGRAPVEVTCVVDERPGMEVDEHAVAVCRYEGPVGLSKFETRWGTFTDPWTHQPQPKCGFVVVGTRGTIASYDYETTIRVQTADAPQGRDVPVDTLAEGFADPIGHLVHHLETGAALHGPLDPALCRTGQRIVDTAAQAASQKRTLRLLG